MKIRLEGLFEQITRWSANIDIRHHNKFRAQPDTAQKMSYRWLNRAREDSRLLCVVVDEKATKDR